MSIREFNLPWLITAENYMGTKEIVGRRSNSIIMGWAKALGGWIGDYYTNDDIPWCGLFMAACMQENNIHINIKNPLSARAWNEFGEKTTPRFGAIMVFTRRGGGHTGFYISEDDTTYHILGGNQTNTVNIIRVKKNRFIGARWPSEYTYLANTKRIYKQFDGTISDDES